MKQIQTEINVNNDKKTRDKQRGPYQKTGENFGVLVETFFENIKAFRSYDQFNTTT
jgi:hypothetical protein